MNFLPGFVCGLLLAVFSLKLPAAEAIPVLSESQPFERILTVTNPYARAVRITTIDTSCACDKMELGSYFILPGETTTLSLSISNINRSGSNNHRFWLYVSDPEYPPITKEIRWHIRPHIAVDVLPPNTPLDERPQLAFRDVYQTVSSIRPNEPHRLRKIMRFYTPDDLGESLSLSFTPPADTLWKYEVRQLDRHTTLLIGRNKDGQTEVAPGAYTETLDLLTNHPDKPQIQVIFNVSSDPKSGTLEENNPFNSLR